MSSDLTCVTDSIPAGMRPGEAIIMRGQDIDRSGDIWTYRPLRHKTEHLAHDRVVFLGPQAQAVLTAFLQGEHEGGYLFSPAEADRERRLQLHAARVTPMSCGNIPGSNRKRRPRNIPGHLYQRNSYTRAISRACDEAFPIPLGMDDVQAQQWRKEHHWHPHQLRHNAATRLRKEFGIDAAQVILGHKTLAVTAIYAEKDTATAMEIVRTTG